MMKTIGEIIDLMDTELDLAKDYAERSIVMDANTDDVAKKFKAMAEESLKHSTILFNYAVREIGRLKERYTLPVKMKEIWNKKQNYYIEQTAWIKQMLEMWFYVIIRVCADWTKLVANLLLTKIAIITHK